VSAVYRELVERIRGETEELDRVAQRVTTAWASVRRRPGEDAYVDSVALNLHGFYSGLERLFELVIRHVDRSMPTGETWNRSLLKQVAQDFADIRPAVISQEIAVALDEFRRFRHLVRNV